jgi:Uncharacterised nucleotidyltransferase
MRLSGLTNQLATPSTKPSHWLLLQAALLDDCTRATLAYQQWMTSNNVDTLDPGSHRLLPLLDAAITRHQWPHPAEQRIKGVSRHTWAENTIRISRTQLVLRDFSTHGIDHMMLKGGALFQTYGHTARRSVWDLDVLVPQRQTELAVERLRQLGYASPAKPYFGPQSPISYPGMGFSSIHPNPLTDDVDLHWRCLYYSCDRTYEARVWDRSQAYTLGTEPTRRPSDTDLLFQVIAHGMGWNTVAPIRWAADAHVLISSGSIDWDLLCDEAIRNRLVSEVHNGLVAIRNHLQTNVPDDVLHRLGASKKRPYDQARNFVRGREPGPIVSLTRLFVDYIPRSSGLPIPSRMSEFPGYAANSLAPNNGLPPHLRDLARNALAISKGGAAAKK